MGEHRRRAQRTEHAPAEQEPAIQQLHTAEQADAGQEEAHPVHRRRVQAVMSREQPQPAQQDAGAEETHTVQSPVKHPVEHSIERRVDRSIERTAERPTRQPDRQREEKAVQRAEHRPAQHAAAPKKKGMPASAHGGWPKPKRKIRAGSAKSKRAGRFQIVEKDQERTQKLKKTAREWAIMLVMMLGGAAEFLGALGKKAWTAAADFVKEKKWKKPTPHGVAMAVLVCVALVSAYEISAILIRSVRTHKLNDELASQRAALMEESSGEAQALPADEQAIELTPAPQTPVPAAENTQVQAKAPVATAVPQVVRTTKYHQVGGSDALKEMAALHDKNKDLVAWIQIPDVLDLPVVYRDNSYYLTRDFNKQKNAAGTIFLDKNHPFKEKTQNLLLHGHNMKDGTMFGRLAQYLYDGTYLRNHPFIYFDTLWKKEQYVIFAILNVSLDPKNERFFNYFTHDTFASDAEFNAYIRQLQIRSGYAIPIDVKPSDALLTLSTCLEEDRLVIVCRRLREGETRSQLRELIRMSTRQ